jgi:hypothetical protein
MLAHRFSMSLGRFPVNSGALQVLRKGERVDSHDPMPPRFLLASVEILLEQIKNEDKRNPVRDAKILMRWHQSLHATPHRRSAINT